MFSLPSLVLFCILDRFSSGGVNSLPVISQLKSAVQASTGDNEGALQTQEEFCGTLPVAAHVRIAVHEFMGELDEARRARERLEESRNNFLKGMVVGTPVIGHAVGGLMIASGEEQEGYEALKSSSRTVGVIAGGAAGFAGL